MTIPASIRLGLVAVAAAAGLAVIPSAAAAEPLYSVSGAESTASQAPGDADSGPSLLKMGQFDMN